MTQREKELLEELADLKELFNKALDAGLAVSNRYRIQYETLKNSTKDIHFRLQEKNKHIGVLKIKSIELENKLEATEKALINASEKQSYKDLHLKIVQQRKELKKLNMHYITSERLYYINDLKLREIKLLASNALSEGLLECEKLRAKVSELEQTINKFKIDDK